MSVTPSDFDYIRRLIRERSAIVLETGREYLVESRLSPLARAHELSGIPELIWRLKASNAESLINEVVEAMTTNETSFFRDPACFESLQKTILPELIERNVDTRSLTIWSGAASSGQEPYTLAMILEDLTAGRPGWKVRIVATDLCESMLERCRSGLYSQLEVNRGLPTQLLLRHFRKQGTRWLINEELRRMIEFKPLNLVRSWPGLPQVDLILLRNVMIYFDVETKKQILARIRHTLRPDGYLVLGSTETTINLDSQFERKTFGRAVFYQSKSKVGSLV